MRRPLPLFLLGILLGNLALPARGAEPPVSEAAVKAAFVYNFVKFVEWSGDGQAPIRICLYGNRDPFLAAMAGIDGKTAQNRSIRVQKVGIAEFRECQILAIAESERRQLPEILRHTQGSGMLTVGEAEGFVDAGGIIGLVVENERVFFEVNLEAAQHNNVKLSSQLLKLARRIRR